jgi:hypothetical protein
MWEKELLPDMVGARALFPPVLVRPFWREGVLNSEVRRVGWTTSAWDTGFLLLLYLGFVHL